MRAIPDLVKYRLSQGFLTIVALCYVIQVFSPLRLNTDAVLLLSIADSAAHGSSFLDSGHVTVFPPGYPALLVVMRNLGLGHSWGIISVNILLLSGGLFITYYLLVREFSFPRPQALFVCAFFLLSFVVIKHFTVPLTDIPYFFCSMSCVGLMYQAAQMNWSWRRYVALALAASLFGMAAIAIRRVGIALVPPLAVLIIFDSKPPLEKFCNRITSIMAIALALAFLGLTTIYLVGKTYTLSDHADAIKDTNLFMTALRIGSYRLMELGEIGINIPISKAPTNLHFVVPWIGLILLLLTFFGMTCAVLKRKQLSIIEVYLGCYVGILSIWPFSDARFWLPVIPLLIAYLVLGARNLRLPNGVSGIYCIVFAALGLVAIAYSTRITFAGSTFPEKYGDGTLRATYCAALKACRDGAGFGEVDGQVMHLIREYN